MDPDVQIILWFIAGAMGLISGNSLRNKYQRLQKNGLEADGLVTQVIDDTWFAFLDGRGLYQYSIRFVTADKRWITKSYTQLASQEDSLYKAGETLRVLYNPVNPEEFMIHHGRANLAAYTMMSSGTGCIGYCFWLIFQQL
ncbi:DUF3592 domain-containing protein [Hymenobacter pini]|uniref:DUF3592 domain-containing protein n=1 Tax=Hymenobacter pini TaxID=2880879 RepID=UPI001CF13E00|nr:DUF3592 domain-containing protein [Hymenobacter pini]MCA8829528.1 DUF3592 domain-containing protein [Hymenobacter pini]